MKRAAIDPLTRASAAKELKILELLDRDTGEFIDTRKFIESYKYGEIIEPRQEIRLRWKTGTPKYVCCECLISVSLLAGKTKNWFYFRHLKEDGRCSAKTRGDLNHKQINAIRYAGIVESEPHKRFKQLMHDCLRADPSFTDVEIEKTRISSTSKGKRRTPDVSANKSGLVHAFEVQLSTTFLDVVLDRRCFYRDEGAILIWVLPDFSPDGRTMMEDDIFFHNNCNVLVLNEEIATRSISEEKLYFGCWYRQPFANGTEYSEQWKYEVVTFDNLKVDVERQRIFYFDYETEKLAINREIERQQEVVQKNLAEKYAEKRRNTFRKKFEDFWLEYARGKAGTARAWNELVSSDTLAYRDFSIPPEPTSDTELWALLK